MEIKVFYDAKDASLATELIPLIFDDFGIQGVIIESPEIESEDGWFDHTVIVPKNHSITAYLPITNQISSKIEQINHRLLEIESVHHIPTRLVLNETNDENWSESWKEFFFPEKIGKLLVVKPTWREYQSGSGEIVIELDPGMAFGTGAHPTTRLCIQLLETYLTSGCRFLDVGTGSGILMIAAAKLGANFVKGIDKDEVAVDVARKNLCLNHIDPNRYQLVVGNLVEQIADPFDMVVANILTETILVLLDDIPNILSPNGIFICSGIIDSKKEAVLQKMIQKGFDILSIKELETWVAIAGKIKPS